MGSPRRQGRISELSPRRASRRQDNPTPGFPIRTLCAAVVGSGGRPVAPQSPLVPAAHCQVKPPPGSACTSESPGATSPHENRGSDPSCKEVGPVGCRGARLQDGGASGGTCQVLSSAHWAQPRQAQEGPFWPSVCDTRQLCGLRPRWSGRSDGWEHSSRDRTGTGLRVGTSGGWMQGRPQCWAGPPLAALESNVNPTNAGASLLNSVWAAGHRKVALWLGRDTVRGWALRGMAVCGWT